MESIHEKVDVLVTAIPKMTTGLENLTDIVAVQIPGVDEDDWARLEPIVDALESAAEDAVMALRDLRP